jgi:hypothetical protein
MTDDTNAGTPFPFPEPAQPQARRRLPAADMPSYFGPPEPFHVEALYRHVVELEGLWRWIPEDKPNAREALAKAIVAASAAFLEGSLDHALRVYYGSRGEPMPELDGLRNLLEHVQSLITPRPDATARGAFALLNLRNNVDHGDRVDPPRLKLDAIGSHRAAAAAYVREVFPRLGLEVPGWL